MSTTIDHIAELIDLFPGQHIERIHGEIVIGPRATASHQRAIAQLLGALSSAARGMADLAVFSEPSVIIDGHELCPDVVAYRADDVDDGAAVQERAPVAVIEVLSPGSGHRDRVDKAGICAAAVAYGYVDPEGLESVVASNGTDPGVVALVERALAAVAPTAT